MRVLYFSNVPVMQNITDAHNGGGWISSIIDLLKKRTDLVISVCFFGNQDRETICDNVKIYEIKRPQGCSFFRKIKERISLFFPGYLEAEVKSWPAYENKLVHVVDDFKPDVVHVFGSELQFGLIANKIQVPLVLHIQGILNPYFNALYPPSFARTSNLKELMKYRMWEKSCLREKEILVRVKKYIGRTKWDERVTKVFNREAQYFYGGEILRESFYGNVDRKFPQKLTIVSTISSPIYKGFDLILKTASLLKNELKLDFLWLVYGNVKSEYIEKKVNIKHSDVNISLMGVVSADNLKEAICHSTLFVHPSYIDNSPNSVCEAQLLGSTVLAANVGGLPSLIEDGKTGFLFPANDPYQLAYLIQKVYSSQTLNNHIGQNARDLALKRHNRENVVSDLIGVYKKIVENGNN